MHLVSTLPTLLHVQLLLLLLLLSAHASASPFEELSQPLCPSEDTPVSVRCSVVSQPDAETQWTVRRSGDSPVQCSLPHRLTAAQSMDQCGPGNVTMVDSESQGNTYVSEFRFFPTRDVDGLEIECSATSNSNIVYRGQVEIAVAPLAPTIHPFTEGDISDKNQTSVTLSISWKFEDSNADISRFVIIPVPPTSQCASEGCVIGRDNDAFQSRTFNLTLPIGGLLGVSVRADNCNDRQFGSMSESLHFNLKVPKAVESCNATVIFNQSDMLTEIDLNFSRVTEPFDVAPSVTGSYVVASNGVWYMELAPDEVCFTGRCFYRLENFKEEQVFEELSVMAVNAISLSAETACTSQKIEYVNNLLNVSVNVTTRKAVCTFPGSWRGSECTLTLGNGGGVFSGSVDDGLNYVTIELKGLPDHKQLDYYASSTDGQLTVIVEGAVTGTASSDSTSVSTYAIVGAVVCIAAIITVITVTVIVLLYNRKRIFSRCRKGKQDGDVEKSADEKSDTEIDGPKTFLKGGSDGKNSSDDKKRGSEVRHRRRRTKSKTKKKGK